MLMLSLSLPILANAGLPMVIVFLPPAWLALVPIIVIESAYGAWRLKLHAGRALAAQSVANCVSTLIGIPVTWLVLVLIEFVLLEGAVRIAPQSLLSAFTPIVGAAWLGPGAEEKLWMMALAITLLTAAFYLMSVSTEGFIIARFFPDVPRKLIRRWSFEANAISYALLVVLILLAWSMPRTSERVFAPIRSLTEHLVDIVFSVADWTSGSSNPEPPLIRAVEAGDLARVRKLIARGTNVNVTDNDGGTALQSAAASGNYKMTRLLLDAGADVNTRQPGSVGYDALDQAAWTGNGETIRTLLSAGARVTDPAGGGWTPLMIAMLYGYADVVEALLDGGADVNARTPAGWTALKEARFRGNEEMAERLIRAGAIDYSDGSRD
jgi:hypothetical protein